MYILNLFRFELVAALVLVFGKIKSEDKTKHENFCSSSKPEIIINGIEVVDIKYIYIHIYIYIYIYIYIRSKYRLFFRSLTALGCQ